MSYIRVFNDFKRRLINGEVEPSFNCSAYLMNSNYEQIYDNLQYMRSINDFETIDRNALRYSNIFGITGAALASGSIIRNDYYRVSGYNEDEDFTSDPVFVTSANSASYIDYAAANSFRKEVMKKYIDTFGGFFLVSKIDEFNKMCSIIEKSDCERYAVVLADDIENVIVNNALFNKTRQHPFRGVFDGNGYALQIDKMFVNDRTCGIFGYIADEGVVRNLIVQPAKIKNVTAINVHSTSQISLETIKTGQGDVRFGVLAGVNEGFCENVVVSGNIAFYGRWRPNIYFTHNKYVDDSMDEVSLYCPEWESAPSYDVESVTALSSFTNICFPTQLCINSEANLIPYVGYFGEAAFAHAVEQAAKFNKPLYEYPMSGYLGDPDLDDFSRDDKTTTFCRDIEKLYTHYCYNYNHAEGTNGCTYSPLHTQGQVMQRGTFRIGPNHRASYLIGGLFGLNNGSVKYAGYSGTMEFNNCTVALIGGIAGRQARGTSDQVIGNVKISTTSGAFEDTVNIKLPAKYYFSSRAGTIPLSAIILSNSYIPGDLTVIAEDNDNQSKFSCSIYENGQGSKRFLPPYQLKSSYVGELSASASDNGQSDYNFYACKVVSVSSIPANQLGYLTDEISVRCNAFPNNTAALRPYSVNMSHAFLRIDDINASTQSAYIVAHDTNTYQHVDGKSTEDIKLVTDLSEIYVNLSGIVSNSSVYCTVTAKVSATNIQNYMTLANGDNRISTQGETTDVNIKMPPIFHVGGYCGEYVITDRYLRSDYAQSYDASKPFTAGDTQLLYDMSNCGGFASFNSTAEVSKEFSGRQYSAYNTIAGFAASVSLDTMNKSDCDTISSYAYTSATREHYKNFSTVNFDAYQIIDCKLTSLFAKPARFTRYFNYTPDMMPAVVMAASHGHSHSKAKLWEPNFGITWLDQLFYGTGNTDPGSEGEDNDSNVAYWMKNNEWTDKYINTVAQVGYSTNNGRAPEQNEVYYDKTKLLGNFFKFKNDRIAVTLSAYVTKQMPCNTATFVYSSGAYNNINAPYQYMNGRAGYDSTRYTEASARASSYSFDTYDSNYYYTTTANAYFNDGVEASDVGDKANNITGFRPKHNLQSYIFTYSSAPVLNKIPPVPLNMSYCTAYSLRNVISDVPAIHIPDYIAWEATQKCYTVTSDSYNYIVNNNTSIPSTLQFNDEDNQPITSNRVVYGFIPQTADIIKCLDTDPLAHLYCSGVSADDLQYMLVLDDKQRPIFDMKLDVNSVKNQGYEVVFPKTYFHRGTHIMTCTYNGGLGINIKTGN